MSAANGILRLTDGDTISRNTVTVTPAAGGQARIIDTTADGGLGPGSAFDLCIPITARELLCDVRKIRVIRIDVGSDDDRVSYRHPLPARLFGGGGRDELRGGARQATSSTAATGPIASRAAPGDDAVGGGAWRRRGARRRGRRRAPGRPRGSTRCSAATATTSCAPATATPTRSTAAAAPTGWPPTTPTPRWAARPSSARARRRRQRPAAAGRRRRLREERFAVRAVGRRRASRCAAAGVVLAVTSTRVRGCAPPARCGSAGGGCACGRPRAACGSRAAGSSCGCGCPRPRCRPAGRSRT